MQRGLRRARRNLLTEGDDVLCDARRAQLGVDAEVVFKSWTYQSGALLVSIDMGVGQN